MPQTPSHLMIGTPCYGGQVFSLYATSLMKLQHACARRGNVDLSVNLLWGDALITRARQNLAAHFLENPQATHLLFVDADIAFEPDQVFRLLDFGVDVAAGVYPTKRIDWPKVEKMAKEGRAPLETSSLSYVLELEQPPKLDARDGFARARYAGTGFMLIRRNVLASMIEKYPELRYTREHQAEDPLQGSRWRSALFNCLIDESTGTYLSEDYSFCRRFTDMGGEIWVDLQSRLTHIGVMAFNGNLASQFPAPPK